jgi:hypothetical protein
MCVRASGRLSPLLECHEDDGVSLVAGSSSWSVIRPQPQEEFADMGWTKMFWRASDWRR